MYRILTIAREYGSGGSIIARKVADRLGWELLDSKLIDRIVKSAKVDPSVARELDERVDPWYHRLSRRALWHGSFEGVAAVGETDVFDAHTMAAISRGLIEEAAEIGNCVMVGRGAQCVLLNRPDTFRVFVYGPRRQRLQRLRERLGERDDFETLMDETDKQRTAYIQLHYECDAANRHLYHLMIDSALGLDEAASVILFAMGRAEGHG